MPFTSGQPLFATGADTCESKTAAAALTALGITSSVAELNILDGVTATAAELNILDGVTATAAELNILDGVTASTAELNYVDGVTSAIQTQLDGKQATLVSATNIKTINGSSILGSGDLVVSGGGSGTELALDATPATDDTYDGVTIDGLTNSGGVTQWDAVYLNSSGAWVLADANGTGTYPARGLALTTEVNTATVNVLTIGVVRNDAWNWTPGATIYLSTTAGGLTQTAPSASGDCVQAVGYALSADVAYFDFNSAYVVLT